MYVPADLAVTLAAVVDAGTIDAAAKGLHLTQSAVSQRIATLERLTGQVLLVRSRPVSLTAAGEIVARYAREVAHLDADLARSLGLDEDHRMVLPIAVNADSLATWILAPLVEAATALDVTLDLHREDEAHTAALLTSGRCVGAVTTQPTAVPGCSVSALGSIEYRAFATPAFVARWFPDGPHKDALAVAPVMDFDAKDTIQTQWLEANGVDPQLPPRHHVPSSTEFAEAIGLGLGWGLLPEVQRAGLSHRVEALGGPAITQTLYWQQWRTHSEVLDSVASALKTAASNALA